MNQTSATNNPQVTIGSKAAPVEFQSVSKVYGQSVLAVDSVSLQVAAGELVTLLGPSGCGKTTTLRMIAGLEKPTSGRIFIGGQEVTHLPATDRDVTMVFQSYALFPHMTVRENIAYGLKVSKLPRAEIRSRTDNGLSLVGLDGYGDRLPSELSGGQQQRVAVARALVLEPQVLLFDEPLSNLDAKLRRQVREDIRDIQQRLGLTVVYVTHDQEEALAVSDRIIVMNNAVIAQIGTPRELYDKPVSEFVADFIGEANIFNVNIDRVEGNTATASLGNIELHHLDRRNLNPGPAKLAVRPNRVNLSAAQQNAPFTGVIEKSTYVGSHMEYRVQTDHGNIFVIDENIDSPFAEGTTTSVTFERSGPVLLPA